MERNLYRSDALGVIEEHGREVKLGWGVVVSSFYDPPHYAPGAKPGGQDPPTPVRRWRVRLPNWFPTGSWLHGEHAFASLADALTALEESGTLDAVDAYWHALSAKSAARQAAFSKIMAAHAQRDRSYDDLLRARHERAKAHEQS